MRSYSNREVRLLQHDKSIVVEDNLDTRWEELTQENVDNVIFLSKHTAATNRPALTIHPIGISAPYLYVLHLFLSFVDFDVENAYSSWVFFFLLKKTLVY